MINWGFRSRCGAIGPTLLPKMVCEWLARNVGQRERTGIHASSDEVKIGELGQVCGAHAWPSDEHAFEPSGRWDSRRNGLATSDDVNVGRDINTELGCPGTNQKLTTGSIVTDSRKDQLHSAILTSRQSGHVLNIRY